MSGMIHMVSGVNPEGKPFCHLSWGEQHGQLSPEELRAHALRALEIAEAAEMDAIVLEFLKDLAPDAPLEHRVVLLRRFRVIRDTVQARQAEERKSHG